MRRLASPSAILIWTNRLKALAIFSLHGIHRLDLTSDVNLSNVSKFSTSNDYLEANAPTPFARRYQVFVLLLFLRVGAWGLMA
jgi:hypothetical protein